MCMVGTKFLFTTEDIQPLRAHVIKQTQCTRCQLSAMWGSVCWSGTFAVVNERRQVPWIPSSSYRTACSASWAYEKHCIAVISNNNHYKINKVSSPIFFCHPHHPILLLPHIFRPSIASLLIYKLCFSSLYFLLVLQVLTAAPTQLTTRGFKIPCRGVPRCLPVEGLIQPQSMKSQSTSWKK